MSRRVVTMITGAVLLIALAIGGSQLPVPYAELGPGPTLNTLGVDQSGEEIIKLTGRIPDKTKGHLNLTTVSVRDRLDLLAAMRGWLDPDRAVVPREEIFPPGQTEQETEQKNTRDFVTSQNSAELAALAYLDFTEVVVSSLVEGSPSEGKLAEKDVLTAVQGQAVGDVSDLARVLGATKPGPTVTVADDLTGGKFIAGTGTIDVSGTVGAIGGIPLKLIAAKEKGAAVFLVPGGNCAEATRRPPAGLQLVKVDTLGGAVGALDAIRNGDPAPTCPAS